MLDLDVVCVTVDTEWAHPEVLADLIGLLEEGSVRATFFCTGPGISVPGHERAIHPNFRWDGDAIRSLGGVRSAEQAETLRAVVELTKGFCPEATGVRCHSLFYDSQLLPIFRAAGISYDSTYFLPLTAGIRPVMKEYGILELPIYWMDHWHILERGIPFALSAMQLERPGLKVLDFHPNIVFINAQSQEDYIRCKALYHHPGRLRERRSRGRGVRTLLLELLHWLNRRHAATMTMGEVDRWWRGEMAATCQSDVMTRAPSSAGSLLWGCKIHHLAYAVAELDGAVQRWKELVGAAVEAGPFEVAAARARACFLTVPGWGRIELVQPLNGLGRSQRWERPDHVCFVCNDFDGQVARAHEYSGIAIGPPAPSEAFGGRRMCFVLYRDIGLIEWVEE